MAINRGSGKNAPVEVASGVDALVSRLRDEGVKSGRMQAEQIVKEAQTKAETAVKQAQQEAEQIVSKARGEVENLQRGGKKAIELAFRDTMLAVKSQLTKRFTGEVLRLVGEREREQELLEKMILEIAGRVKEEVEQSKQVEVLLPREVTGIEELSSNPEELEKGILTQFVRLTSKGMLRAGISCGWCFLWQAFCQVSFLFLILSFQTFQLREIRIRGLYLLDQIRRLLEFFLCLVKFAAEHRPLRVSDRFIRLFGKRLNILSQHRHLNDP